MLNKKVFLATLAAAVLSAGAGSAQTQTDPAKARADVDKTIELMRKDVRAEKADIIGKTMKLDATQAATFWPIYKQYEAEAQALGNERLAIIQDLSEFFDSLDDAKAKALLERSMALEEKKVALMKKYKDEMLKALPAKTVARFFQVDSRLNKVVDLTVSSEIPLVY